MRTEDGHIVYKCLNGEPEAFGFLVDKYKGAIYAFAYAKLRNFHDAEDVTQEVFIKAYQKLRTLRRWDSVLAWLYSITSNLCKEWLRSRASRPDREFVEDQSPGALARPSVNSYLEGVTRESLYESLQEALDSLPEIYSQVLTLYYLGGMSNKEIARFLGTSSDTVRQRLTRARSQLKEEMLAMMNTTFEEQKLRVDFTFRIVEAVKWMKIHPTPRTAGLPWGLSLATGLMIAVLSLGSHVVIQNPMLTPAGSPVSNGMKVLKTGEISVDILRVPQKSVIASKQTDGVDGSSAVQAPQAQIAFISPAEEGEWTQKDDMPTARFGLCTSVVNGKIYAIGGSTEGLPLSGDSIVSTVERYDPATDNWTKKADMPTPRAWFSTSVVNGKIYAVGGRDRVKKVLSTVEEYDPLTDTWTEKADMPTARTMLSTSVVNGKIYAIGGGGAAGVLSTVEEYDPAADTWTRKADMPTKRRYLSTSVVDGNIYAIGGTQNDSFDPLATVEAYDPVTDTWMKKADMPTGRMGLSTSAVDGEIYAIGGFRPKVEVPTVEAYDPLTDTWTKKADITARGELSTSAVGEHIYAIGGVTGWDYSGILSLVEEYDPESVAVEPREKLPTRWGEAKSE